MQDRTTTVAIFSDRTQAQRAISELKAAGFTEEQIGVTARESDGAERLQSPGGKAKTTHAKEGAVAGVAAGAGVGTLWGLGILAGVVPAIGPAIAGGTLVALLSSAAAGAATAGLAGTLIGLGIPEEEAKFYDEEFRSGRTVVTVRTDGRASEVASILEQCGGYDMRSTGPATPRAGAAESIRDQRSL